VRGTRRSHPAAIEMLEPAWDFSASGRAAADPVLRDTGALRRLRFLASMFIHVSAWLKAKKTHRRLAVGFEKSSEQIRTRPPRGTTAARSAAGLDSNCDSRE